MAFGSTGATGNAVTNRFLGLFLVISGICSAVPSVAAFHPFTHMPLSSDDDIMGLQDDGQDSRIVIKAATRDKASESEMAKRWRQMAEQARRLAKTAPDKAAQQKLLDLAEGYEALARGAKTG